MHPHLRSAISNWARLGSGASLCLGLVALAPAVAIAAESAIPDGPDPRETSLPCIATSQGTLPGPAQLPVSTNLPEVLKFQNGSFVQTPDQWQHRRQEMKELLSYYAVGLMPPSPGNVQGRVLLSQPVLNGQATYRLVHLSFGPQNKLELNIGILTPRGNGPFPAVILPGSTPPGAPVLPTQPHPPGQGRGVDALLPLNLTTNLEQAAPKPRPSNAPVTAETLASSHQNLVARGYAFITFNNNDCAEDTTLRNPDGSWAFRSSRFYPAYPGCDWGVLAGWAWGVSRIVDYLQTDPLIDKTKLILTGVSRTGKSAMIAAAFDERIAMVAPCVTGGGGMGAFRFSGVGRGGKEGLGEMMRKYPNWFSPHLHAFWGHTDQLPFDQNWMIALVAPRPFLALEGKTDPVSLAGAVQQSLVGAQPAYALLGASNLLAVHYSDHGHTMSPEDWTVLMDFADKYLRGLKVARAFDSLPSLEIIHQQAGTPPATP